MINYKKLNYINLFLYNFTSTILFFIFIEESYGLRVMIISYMLICFATYLLHLKDLFWCPLENDNKGWYFVLRANQIFSMIYLVVSFIVLFGKPGSDLIDRDKNINTGFFFTTLSQIMLNQIYIKKYKEENISSQNFQPPTEPVPQIIINISRIHPLNEIKLFTNNLKGKIVNDLIEECSICLEVKESVDEVISINNIEEIIVLNCSHKFHYKCLNDCFINGIKRCPNCREEYVTF